MNPEELRTVELARQGNAQAFETLYLAYLPRIAGYLRRLVGNPEIAADLAQDVFVNAYRAIGKTQPGLNIAAWLFTIATNTALSHHRRRQRIQWLPLLDSDPDTSRPDPEARCATRDFLATAFARLPREQAACFLLKEVYGFTHDEIASMLGIPAGTARTRTSRARIALAKALRASEEDAR